MRAKVATIILTCLRLKLTLVKGVDSENSTSYFTNGTNRILHGKPVPPSEFPFLVALRINKTELCGGSIIADSWVMSAGHCLYERDCANTLQIFPAVWGRQKSISSTGCIVHPQYTPSQYQYDISLIKVAENFKQLGGPLSICLPQPGTYYPGETPATIVGWGKTEDAVYPDSLLAAETQLEDWDTCNKEWHENTATCPTCVDSELPIRVVCTKGGNLGPSGTCFGDSGGPVIVEKCVIGIIAFVQTVHHVCKMGAPSMHTSVVDYLPWILSIVNPGTNVSSIQVRPEH